MKNLRRSVRVPFSIWIFIVSLLILPIPNRGLLIAQYDADAIRDMNDRARDIREANERARDLINSSSQRDIQSINIQSINDRVRDSIEAQNWMPQERPRPLSRDERLDPAELRSRITEPPEFYQRRPAAAPPVYSGNFLPAPALGEPTFEELLELAQAVKTGDAEKKAEALAKLPQFSRFQVANIARYALNDPNPEVRRAAVRALGEIGCPISICILQSLAKSEDAAMAAWAKEAIDNLERANSGG